MTSFFLFKDRKTVHLAGKISAIEFAVHYYFMQPLKLWHSKSLRKKIICNRVKVQGTFEGSTRFFKNLLVVESQIRKLVYRKPFGLSSIV